MPPIYKIKKFRINIWTKGENNVKYDFNVEVLPSELVFGTYTTRYPFLINSLSSHNDVRILYNYTPGTTACYNYDLSKKMDTTSTVKLENTKIIIGFRLFVYRALGTVEFNEEYGCDFISSNAKSGYLICSLQAGSFISN